MDERRRLTLCIRMRKKGAGKSSILVALLRINDIDEGSEFVLIDRSRCERESDPSPPHVRLIATPAVFCVRSSARPLALEIPAEITIAGQDVAGLGIQTLRQSIIVIPQEPIMLSGGLGRNPRESGEEKRGRWILTRPPSPPLFPRCPSSSSSSLIKRGWW